MESQVAAITSTIQRPPTLHFNQNFFNNINTHNYKHIEISPEADPDTTRFVRAASEENEIAGLTTGLFHKPEGHFVIGQDGDKPLFKTTLNIIEQTCPEYEKCNREGKEIISTFMAFA